MIEARIGLKPSVTEIKRPANLEAEEAIVNRDLLEVSLLQEEFENALNIAHDPQDLLRRSYNPVFDRWHVEKLRREGKEDGPEFKSELRENLRTNLMERLHAVESYGEFAILDGELCRDAEPFGKILERGVGYRVSLGSNEQEREGLLGELGGWAYINSRMVDPETPIGTTIISFSPPGAAEGTVYTGRFVDKFILKERNGERYVERIRIAVDWEYQEYREAALSAKPDYFKDYDGRVEDAWILAHPLELQEDIFKDSYVEISPKTADAIINHLLLKRIEDRYEKALLEKDINWLELALCLNAYLNCADKLKEEFLMQIQTSKLNSINGIADMSNKDFDRVVHGWGMKTVAVVGGGGCPPNKGINLSGLFGSSILDSNSVAQFGVDIGESEQCKCIDKNDNHYHCPNCQKKYEDETNLDPEERTKECSCGVKFGC